MVPIFTDYLLKELSLITQIWNWMKVTLKYCLSNALKSISFHNIFQRSNNLRIIIVLSIKHLPEEEFYQQLDTLQIS